MGNFIVRTWDNFYYPELNPIPYGETTFEPTLGFGKRKERVVNVTKQELIAAKIDPKFWDFCADKHLKVEACKARNAPFYWRCRAESHEASECQYEDYLIRMKEYERERRLIQRKDLQDQRKYVPERKINLGKDL